jgi:hypothetical protein
MFVWIILIHEALNCPVELSYSLGSTIWVVVQVGRHYYIDLHGPNVYKKSTPQMRGFKIFGFPVISGADSVPYEKGDCASFSGIAAFVATVLWQLYISIIKNDQKDNIPNSTPELLFTAPKALRKYPSL